MTTSRQDLEVLIPVEVSQTVLTAVQQQSVIEAVARPEVMTSDTKHVARFGGFTVGTVAKGAEYGFSQNVPDTVELIARKIGGAAKIAEEDLADTITGEATMAKYEAEAGTALANHYDHACLGSTGAPDGVTVKYTSVYRTLATAQTTPWGAYAANANIVQVAASAFSGSTASDAIVDWLAKYEESIWYSEANTVVLGSPAFKSMFRKIRDTTGRTLYEEETSGAGATFFGYKGRWTVGARTNATDTQTPTGNPLLIIGNREFLINGRARTSAGMAPGNPGTQWQRAANGIGFLSDEAIMKAFMRRGFACALPQAFSILEITAA
ncbi:MAG TPA: phage major capsid protein [Armatimonadota bacterium]|nr:phage major capsid protein [Armatimonadota bacterium]